MPAPSKVNQLPDADRAWLDQELVKNGFGRLKKLEAQLAERGYEISKSAIGRYNQKLKSKLEAIRASTEAARSIAEAAPDDADLRSAAVMSLVQTEIFDVLVNLQEASDEDIDQVTRVKLLSHAAKNIATLSRASVNQKKWSLEVRARVQTAVENVERIARKDGLSDDTIKLIRSQLMGIV